MKIIPSPEDFGAALQRPDILDRCAIIMKVINDPEVIKECNRISIEHREAPTRLLDFFPNNF